MVSIIGFITAMLLARFRTLSEYGTYSQVIMVADLVSSLLLLGIPNSINYFLAKADTPEQRRSFLSVYTTLSTILSIIIGLCLYFAMPLIINHFKNPFIKDIAYVFAVYPWSSMFISSIGNVCVVYGKANRLVIFNIINAVAVLAVLCIAKIFDMTFHHYMLMYMGVLFIFAVIGIVWSRKLAGGLRISLDFAIIKNIFIFSIPIGLASMVGTISVHLNKLVIGYFFSTDEYAIFANAAKELPFTMVSMSITAVLLPQLVRMLKTGDHKGAVELWSHAIKISLCFMCLVAAGMFVFAPDALSFMYSEKYVTPGSIAIFRIYSCILIFRAIYWGIILNATGNTKFILYSSLITLALNFVGNFAFFYILGFIGPAVSTIITSIFMCFVQLKFTTKLIKIPFKDIFPWKSMARLIIITIGLAVIFAIIKYVFLNDFPRSQSILISVGLGVLWTLIYVLINLKFIKSSWRSLNANKNAS